MYHKWRLYDLWLLKYKVQQKEIFVILGHFLLFQHPDNLENQNVNIEKKNTWRYYCFTHLHHKWQSYDIWFLRYGARHTVFFVILDRLMYVSVRYEAWQKEFFVIWDCSLHFYPSNNLENKNFEKLKKNAWKFYHFA